MPVALCELCGGPMVAGQRGRHFSCCAAIGGREQLCNTIAKIWYDDADRGFRPCQACWRLGPFLGMKPKREPKPRAKRKVAA